jgi:NAD(P)-dependent dehydrogenase (short-subunit alcohol dehydrogenase family)
MPGHLPSFALTDQVALVTGAARGIGRATALALAEAGADVALGLRVRDSAPDLVAEIEAIGRRALALQMDVTRLDQIEAAVAETEDRLGPIGILVNNAGLAVISPAEDVTEDDYDLPMNVNVKGSFFTAQAVGRRMIARRSGAIVNLGSQAGRVALSGVAPYCMSKAAVDHMTRCLAVEWGPHNVRVNAIAPTFILTDGTRIVLEDPEWRARTVAKIPLGHAGEVLDVVGAVVFLASPAARMITGASLLIDGGWTAV